MKVWGLAAALALAGLAAGAETEPAPPAKVGAHPPQPEVVVAFDRRIELRGTLVIERTGAVPLAMGETAQLRFDLALRGLGPGAGDPLALTCRIVLVEADGRQSPPVREGPCFEGTVPEGESWVAVGAPVRFRPGRSAPAGSAGILVEVAAERGRARKVLATYGWAPEG